MKNNRKNRKAIQMYFKNMNRKYGLTGKLIIIPTILYSRKGKDFAALIGTKNNPKSEIIRNIFWRNKK
jgi:hypothetical protein